MILWSGLGFLVGICGVVTVAIVRTAIEQWTGPESLLSSESWPTSAGLVVAGIVCWPLGRRLNQYTEKEVLDPLSGQPVVIRQGGHHSLLLIPVEHWWGVFMAMAVFAAVN